MQFHCQNMLRIALSTGPGFRPFLFVILPKQRPDRLSGVVPQESDADEAASWAMFRNSA
jgi:hypothetical protein